MLVGIISRMDKSILELALVDAFFDMCFYEGEEFTKQVEQFIIDIEEGKITEDQANKFMSMAEPYIDNSLLAYGSHLMESIPDVKLGADKSTAVSKTHVGADVIGTQSLKRAKEEIQKAKKFNTKSKTLTEAEIYENLATIIPDKVKKGVNKFKEKAGKLANSLNKATISGVSAAQKELQSHMNIPVKGGKAAVTPDA